MELNWIQIKLAEWTRRVRFNINRALKYSYNLGKQKGLEQGRQEKPECLCCPYYLNAKHNAAIAPLSVTTSSKLVSARDVARQASISRILNSQPSGKMLAYHSQMSLQKTRLELLDDAPETARLPAAPKQGAKTRDLRKLIEGEDAGNFLL